MVTKGNLSVYTSLNQKSNPLRCELGSAQNFDTVVTVR
jgi:hypothetical protein